jgi:carboxyl-terminal processing protease
MLKKTSSYLIWLIIPALFISFRLGQQSVSQIDPNSGLDFSSVNAVWNTIQDNYLRVSDLDQNDLKYGLAKGLVNSLDDIHSVYMNPEETNAFLTSLQGDLEGIGAELRLVEGIVMVVSPLPDSPAQKAGIKPGDSILKVNGKHLGTVTNLFDVVTQIRGPRGTEVTLTVVHEADFTPEDIVIVRESIHIESVVLDVIESSGKKIGHVTLASFTEQIGDEFKRIVEDMNEQNIQYMILDMRFNGGGFLDGAVEVMSYLTDPDKPAVFIKDQNGTQARNTRNLGSKYDGKIVVLINESSASASEIVAGAVQDYGLGHVVGMKSFGKGSVQEIHPFSDQSALRITIAEWLTPLKKSIEGEGLEPDELIEMNFDDFVEGIDLQKDAAIDYLLR